MTFELAAGWGSSLQFVHPRCRLLWSTVYISHFVHFVSFPLILILHVFFCLFVCLFFFFAERTSSPNVHIF